MKVKRYPYGKVMRPTKRMYRNVVAYKRPMNFRPNRHFRGDNRR